jgi:hypothetical protein
MNRLLFFLYIGVFLSFSGCDDETADDNECGDWILDI